MKKKKTVGGNCGRVVRLTAAEKRVMSSINKKIFHRRVKPPQTFF